MSEESYSKIAERSESLLTRYKRVAALYKTILDLASKILYEIETCGSEKLIAALIEEKMRVADKIRNETEGLNIHPLGFGEIVNSNTIREAKEIISDIKIMLSELYEKEERINQIAKRKKPRNA
jgi:hypothetical protein